MIVFKCIDGPMAGWQRLLTITKKEDVYGWAVRHLLIDETRDGEIQDEHDYRLISQQWEKDDYVFSFAYDGPEP